MNSGLTLFERIQRRCAERPRRFLDRSINFDGFVESDSDDLLLMAERIAASLHQQVLEPLVVLCLDRCTTLIPAAWGCLAAGLTALPLTLTPSRTRPREQDIQDLVLLFETLGPAVVVVDEISVDAQRWFPAGLNVRWLHLSSLILAQSPAPVDVTPAKIAFVLQTSGTTGTSKYAAFSGEWFEFEQSRNKRVLTLSPLGSSSGFPLMYGLNDLSVYLPLRDAIQNPDLLLEVIERYQLQEIGLPPVMAQRLLRYFLEINGQAPRRDLSSLENVIVGSSTISLDVINALRGYLQSWGAPKHCVQLAYGLTEIGGISCGAFQDYEDHSHPLGVSIGSVNADVQLRIASNDPVQPGEIEVQRYFPFLGYLNGRSFNQLRLEPFSSGIDWFSTGDLGLLVGNTLVFSGRVKDTIVVNSRKISLSLVEFYMQKIWQDVWPGELQEVIACADCQDQLIVFVAHEELYAMETFVPALKRYLTRQLQQQFGVALVDLIMIKPADIPRSLTGKVLKRLLLRSGEKLNHPLQLQSLSDSSNQTVLQTLLSEIRCFAPHVVVRPEQHISTLGIDSLAWAEIIGRVERRTDLWCDLKACPSDPSLADLACLFVGKMRDVWTKQDSARRNELLDLESYPQRQALAQRIRLANLNLIGGACIGPDNVLRAFNQTGDGVPFIFFGKFAGAFVEEIVQFCPRNPVYVVQALRLYDHSTHNAYLACCYIDWLESILKGRRAILVGFCLAGVLALEVARQFWHRKTPARITLLIDWCVGAHRFIRPYHYSGHCIYQVSAGWIQGQSEQKESIEKSLFKLTPNTSLIMWSAVRKDAVDSFLTQREWARCFMRLNELLASKGLMHDSDN